MKKYLVEMEGLILVELYYLTFKDLQLTCYWDKTMMKIYFKCLYFGNTRNRLAVKVSMKTVKNFKTA